MILGLKTAVKVYLDLNKSKKWIEGLLVLNKLFILMILIIN